MAQGKVLPREKFYPEKKSTLEKVYLGKNPQFWSNQADIGETQSTLKMNIFTKFHKDWIRIVDLLLITKFLASASEARTKKDSINIADCAPATKNLSVLSCHLSTI